jgi:phage regulator Rha-like protein
MKLTIIRQKIFDIRGQQVMLDFDLAALYGVETKVLNQAVKRNADRFPKDFMFQLSKKEFENLKSQIVTSSWGGSRKLPHAFTEHGVTMAANLLKSSKAIKMSIAVVRAFISLKQLALQHKDFATQLEELRKELHERIGEHDTQLAGIYDAIENLLDDKIEKKNWEQRERIGYKK